MAEVVLVEPIFWRWDALSHSSPMIINSVICGNGDGLFCYIEDNNEGEGNIREDPMSVIGPFGDCYLHPDNPCIDAGSRSAEEAGFSDRTTQTDGNPDSGIVDMGYRYPVP